MAYWFEIGPEPSWPHRLAFFWLVLALVLFGGAYALAEIGDMSESSRTLMFVMFGAVIVTNAIWQAAGLALVRLEDVILPYESAGKP